MKKLKMIVLCTVAAMAGLTACTQNAPPAAKGETAVASAPVANPLVDFAIEPGVVSACEGAAPVIATVKWAVKDPSITSVKVEVDSANDPQQKTFTAGGASGEARTEQWVVEGVRFHLVDAASGRKLATHEVTGQPCPAS